MTRKHEQLLSKSAEWKRQTGCYNKDTIPFLLFQQNKLQKYSNVSKLITNGDVNDVFIFI